MGLDREAASRLFKLLELRVSNIQMKPKAHKGSVIFCGYADFTLLLDGILFICLCGNSIKLIGGKIHFDPKSEPGKGARSQEWFAHWLPVSAESRAVLNAKLERDSAICQMVADALLQLNPGLMASSGNNPFQN